MLVVLAGSRVMTGRMGVDGFGDGVDEMVVAKMGVAGLVGTGTLLGRRWG